MIFKNWLIISSQLLLLITTFSNQDFESNKKLIFQEEIFETNNWVYSFKKVSPKTDSEKSKDFALKRAILLSRLSLIDYIIGNKVDKIEIVKHPSLRKYLDDAVRFHYNDKKLDSSGLIKVYTNLSDNFVSVVMALPKKSLNQFRVISANKLIDEIVENSFKKRANNNPFLIIEVSKGKFPLECIEYLLDFFEGSYRSNWLSEYYYNKEVHEFPDGFFLEDFLESKKFSHGNCFENLAYIKYFCSHPSFFKSLGDQFKKENLLQCAQYLYFFGSILPNHDSQALECFNNLTDTKLRNISSSRETFYNQQIDSSPVFIEDKNYKNFSKIIQSLGLFRLVNSNAENKDYLSGVEEFNSEPPQIEVAIESFKKSLENDITANSCNYLGRCFVHLEKWKIARIFFMQATRIDEKHPYAMANLAICYKSIGMDEEALRIAQEAIKGNYLDDWAVQEIKNQGLYKDQDADSDLEIEE